MAQRSEGFVELGCSDRTLFRERSGADVYAAYDILAAAASRVSEGRLSRGAYSNLEKALGINRNPQGLLADRALREVVDPVKAFTWDWVHSYLQDGVFTTEVSEVLKACAPFGVTFAQVQVYLKDDSWQFPAASRAKSVALHRVFDSWRSSAADPHQARRMQVSSDERFSDGCFSGRQAYLDALRLRMQVYSDALRLRTSASRVGKVCGALAQVRTGIISLVWFRTNLLPRLETCVAAPRASFREADLEIRRLPASRQRSNAVPANSWVCTVCFGTLCRLVLAHSPASRRSWRRSRQLAGASTCCKWPSAALRPAARPPQSWPERPRHTWSSTKRPMGLHTSGPNTIGSWMCRPKSAVTGLC